MYGTVRDLYFAEKALGHEVGIIDDVSSQYFYGDRYGADGVTPVGTDFGDESDIICWHHAMHEPWLNEPHRNIVMFLHGTPEFNLFTELYGEERALSLIVGAARHNVPKALVTMWARHVPLWEGLFNREVYLIPAWIDLQAFQPSTLKPEPDLIRIAMVDHWRLTREPMGLILGIEWLRKHTQKRIQVDVWGLNEMPSDTWKAVLCWPFEHDIIKLRGNTEDTMKDIYHQADMVVTMSSEETRVVREAYACGVPVVCGHEKLPFTKYSVEPLYAERVAETILRCHQELVNQPQKVRLRLRRYAEKNFDVRVAAREVLNIFKTVVAKHGTPNRPRNLLADGRRKVCSTLETLQALQERLEKRRPVCYLRYGDGQLFLMAGHEGWDYWHHGRPELRQELIEAFQVQDPDYLVACTAGQENEGRMRPGCFARHATDDELQRIVRELAPDRQFHNAVALAYRSAFFANEFIEFLEKCVRNRTVLLIGNEAICSSNLVRQALNVAETFVVPRVDAYDTLTEQRIAEFRAAVGRNELVLSAAGPVSNVLGYRLWKSGWRGAFLDIGSLADGLAGVESHGWIRQQGADYRKPYLAAYARSARVDIVMLTHGQPEVTKRCLEALREHTKADYRLIWVDNGSGDDFVNDVMSVAEKINCVELLRLDNNQGFSKAVNVGLHHSLTKGGADYVVLLNNDVIVTHDWLARLIGVLELSGVGAVGPLTSSGNPQAVDKLREALPELPQLPADASVEQCATLLWDKSHYKAAESNSMLSFFCVLLRQDTVRAIGALDDALFAYGEDNDYTQRLIRAGHKLGLALGVYVHHDHHVTANAMGDGWKEEQSRKAVAYLKQKYAGIPAKENPGPFWKLADLPPA
jgi:GT2 family glycosyltransferase/glycosyltransferase involved in cell wall biosynthesis